ncbi:MAG: ribbon-helix-helix domain-containing protein [Ruminococcus sp.]|nr:ribbon-helix-helix domain-containing protein [Ruminococcus sp.]MCM1391940.1 ribbon-helix-helix domain-containing protein [Ruminococcus sp.]
MANEFIEIKKKDYKRGDDGYKVISVRMKEETIKQLEDISAQTNRSRNEVINILIENAIDIVKISE